MNVVNDDDHRNDNDGDDDCGNYDDMILMLFL